MNGLGQNDLIRLLNHEITVEEYVAILRARARRYVEQVRES